MTPDNELTEVVWRKSSYSTDTACVEIAFSDEAVMVRDSKQRTRSASVSAVQPVLTFTPREWWAFLSGVKAGEFDMKS